MRIRFSSVALVLLAGPLTAQHLDFGFGVGVKGGYPFTDLIRPTGAFLLPAPNFSSQDNYLVGPAVEMRIPFGFAIEVDGLYRGTNYQVTSIGGPSTTIKSSSWEIPYLAKFRFPIPLLKPFIAAGGSYRTFNDLPSNVTPTHNAFVAAGGLELRLSRLRLSGEVRYLHWGQSPQNEPVRLVQNQGELLFGLIF